MVSGQNGPRHVIEPRPAVLAPVALPMPLGVIMALADHGCTGTARAAHSFRPAMVPDQLIAFGIIDQGGQIDHLQRSHGSVPAEGRRLPSQQPKALSQRHNLPSDMGPMVAPFSSAASTPKPRMSQAQLARLPDPPEFPHEREP